MSKSSTTLVNVERVVGGSVRLQKRALMIMSRPSLTAVDDWCLAKDAKQYVHCCCFC